MNVKFWLQIFMILPNEGELMLLDDECYDKLS